MPWSNNLVVSMGKGGRDHAQPERTSLAMSGKQYLIRKHPELDQQFRPQRHNSNTANEAGEVLFVYCRCGELVRAGTGYLIGKIHGQCEKDRYLQGSGIKHSAFVTYLVWQLEGTMGPRLVFIKISPSGTGGCAILSTVSSMITLGQAGPGGVQR